MKKNIWVLTLVLLALLALPALAQAQAEPAAACAHTAGWSSIDAEKHACPLCGEERVHTLSRHTTEATCQSVGYTMDVCTACLWQSEQYDIRQADPQAHIWGEWTELVEPTCSAAGLRERTCTVCAETQQQESEPAEHELLAVIVEPTCVEDGYTILSCKNCDYAGEKTDIVPRSAAYHKWGEFSVTAEPTCETPGSQERKCSVCGANHRQEIEPTGHSVEKVTVAPGCEDGYTVDICTVCKEEIGERTQIIPGVHKWSKWEQTADPSCEGDGLRVRLCFACEKREEEILPATGHEFKEGVCKPTCVSDGYTAVVCAVCGEQDGEAYDIIPAGEEFHVWDDSRWERESEPTCTQWGLYYQGCMYCEAMKEVPIMPKGHEAEEFVFAADFAHDGYSVEICSVCGAEVCPRYDIVPAGMYAAEMMEMQVSDLEIKGMESAVLFTAQEEDGQTASVLEIRADASGIVDIDFEDEWFDGHNVVRAVVYSGELSVTVEAEGKVHVEMAAAHGEEGSLLSVLVSLPNDGFSEEHGEYKRGVYSAQLSQDAPLVLRGRCVLISAPRGTGTLLVVSTANG